MTARAVPPQRLCWLAAGFGLWGSALAVLYAVQAIGCAFGWPAGPVRLGLAALLVAHLIVIGSMWRALAANDPDPIFGETGTLLRRAAIWSVVAAFAATALILAPPLLLTLC
jgi:hypothetical protein